MNLDNLLQDIANFVEENFKHIEVDREFNGDIWMSWKDADEPYNQKYIMSGGVATDLSVRIEQFEGKWCVLLDYYNDGEHGNDVIEIVDESKNMYVNSWVYIVLSMLAMDYKEACEYHSQLSEVINCRS